MRRTAWITWTGIAPSRSPSARTCARDAVDSNNYNHASMVRTIQEIFGIPPRTRFLKAARAMTSIFTAQADTPPTGTSCRSRPSTR